MSLRIVFMGTPEFAIASLKSLLQHGFNITTVVTSPDKPAGRGQKIQIPPVKKFAIDNCLILLQPEKLKDSKFVSQLRSLQADLFVVVAFRMLPEEIWSMPRLGTINLHASLLPQYRGAAPINWAIINGEEQTGVTTFFIGKEIDTGKILANLSLSIKPAETAGQLHDKLMEAGADLLVKTIKAIESGNINPIDQNKIQVIESKLKTAPKLTKENCRIDWSQESKTIFNLIRGLSPYPAAWSILQNIETGQKTSVKIIEAEFTIDRPIGHPGIINSDGNSFLHVSTSNGIIPIKVLQAEGKKMLHINDFLRGFRGIEKFNFI